MLDIQRLNKVVPRCLQELPQWVLWKYQERNDATTKVPYDAKTGQCASSTDPATWNTFERAIAAYDSAHDRYDGIGFVFSQADLYCGIDLDDCVLADGGLAPWAREIVDLLPTYTEISPSGKGVKLFMIGRKPEWTNCSVKTIDTNCSAGRFELYDRSRYFVVTGDIYPGCVADVTDCQEGVDILCRRFWKPESASQRIVVPETHDTRITDCLRDMLAIRMADQNDGSRRLLALCCRCVEYDLPDQQSVDLIRTVARHRPFPTEWTDSQIIRRIRDAERRTRRGAGLSGTMEMDADTAELARNGEPIRPTFKSVANLLAQFPELRRPVIHGLIREGETANLIAPPKRNKSWLVTDLGLSVATGLPWLNRFPTEQGKVLIIDNELHGETSANRIPRVIEARGVSFEQVADRLFIENLRGQLRDLLALGSYFSEIEPGTFKLVILDAFYRFIPRNTDENDNGSVAQLYNLLDHWALRLGCAFAIIHHASKGNQSGKSVTDVGAGAGSQSRATDAHLILRDHEEEGVVVLDAAVRSWPPIEPMCLRWEFPVFNPAPELDPTMLRPERPRRRAAERRAAKQEEPKAPEWDTDMFLSKCVSNEGKVKDVLVDAAVRRGISKAAAMRLLRLAEAEGKVHRWVTGANRPVRFASVPQPLIEVGAQSK